MITLDSDRKIANMSTILLIILILLLIGALPTWAYSANGVLPEWDKMSNATEESGDHWLGSLPVVVLGKRDSLTGNGGGHHGSQSVLKRERSP